MLKIEIAGIPIGLDNRFKYIEKLVEGYLTEREPLFTVSATDEELRREAKENPEGFPDYYLESVVLYRNIAVRLPDFDAFVFHGAALEYGGLSYLFTARSGVGKTTHTRLWLSEFEGARYINGDKPVIRFIDGVPYVFGTPWRGKENYGENISAPLCSIALLRRGEKNEAEEISAADAAVPVMSQIYIPRSASAAAQTMRLADMLLSSVRTVRLSCNMDAEAAHVAKEAMISR
jgi:hypothetical protein